MFICDISIHNKYGKQMLDDFLRPLLVDWRELVVILVIEQIPGITQTRLIPFLQTDKANVTKLLQVMERKDLIKRGAAGSDQRNKVCFLTGSGEKIIPDLRLKLKLWEAACFQGVSPEELASYKRVGKIIAQNLVNER